MTRGILTVTIDIDLDYPDLGDLKTDLKACIFDFLRHHREAVPTNVLATSIQISSTRL